MTVQNIRVYVALWIGFIVVGLRQLTMLIFLDILLIVSRLASLLVEAKEKNELNIWKLD